MAFDGPNSENPCPNRNTLIGFLVGKLPDESADSVANHLESCLDCQSELATLSDIEDTLVGQLRMSSAPDPLLDESECGEAIARVKAMPGDANDPAEGAPETSQTSLPMQLGEYRLIERLGIGGMGTVYKALHSKLDRMVALKILPHTQTDDRRAVVRFEREMKAIGRLDHPQIVRAFDAREIEGRLVLAMEFVDGLDLGKILRRLGRLNIADACELARQAALGLQAAADHGLIHRDVKPSNLMLTPEGQVKVLDLGLARFYREPAAKEEMTNTGQAMGTADYMAPEQASDSRAVDIRADVYSLGATLYKLLSGRAPFSGPEYQGTFDKLIAHRQTPVPPIALLCPTIPAELAAILDRMLAKDPAGRFSTPAEVAEALTPFCVGENLPAVLKAAQENLPSPASGRGAGGDGSSLAASAVFANPPSNATDPLAKPSPSTTGRGSFISKIVVALMIGGFGFFLGVIVVIKYKDGQETKIEASDGSSVQVTADGQAKVEVPGQASAESPKNDGENAIGSTSPMLPLGPTIEQVIHAGYNDDGRAPQGEGQGLDLLNNKLVDLPKDFDSQSDEQQEQWAAENHVDLLTGMVTAGGAIGHVDHAIIPKGMRFAVIDETMWRDSISLNYLLLALGGNRPGVNFTDGSEMATIRERKGVISFVLQGIPATFAFQTRQGTLGILQVLRPTESPAGLRIRYKCVPPNAADPLTIPEKKASSAEVTKLFQEAGQLKADDVESHTRIGLAMLKAGVYLPAIELLRKAVQIKPDDAEAQNSLGYALLQGSSHGNVAEAIEHLQKSLSLRPDYADAHNNLGLALIEAGQAKEAIEHYQKAVDLKPDDPEFHYNFGIAYSYPREHEKTIEQLRQCLKLKPDHLHAHFNLGVTLAKVGRLSEAIEQYRQAIRLSPNYFAAYDNMAEAYARMNLMEDAIAAAQMTLKIASRDKSRSALIPELETRIVHYRTCLSSFSGSSQATAETIPPNGTPSTSISEGQVAPVPNAMPNKGSTSDKPEPAKAEATRGTIDGTIRSTGTLEPEEIVAVYPQVAGRIISFGLDAKGKPIDFNSVVEKDMVLASIDQTPYRDKLDFEKAGLKRTEGELQVAHAKLLEAERKHESMEALKAAMSVAEANVEQSKIAVRIAQTNFDQTLIRSPIKGLVVARQVNLGQNVGQDKNASLFLIAKDPTKLQLGASVNEANIGQIKPDMSVQFTVDALPKETFHGKVAQIRKNASMTNNVVTYTVVVSVDNPDGKLIPYMTANVVFGKEPSVKEPSVKEPQKTDDKKPVAGNLEALDQQLKELSAKCMAGQASIDEYLKAASPSDPAVTKNESDSEESAKIRLKYAEMIFNCLDQQFQNGAVTQLERTKAKMARDIVAAEVKKDPLGAARAKVESTEKIFKLEQFGFQIGRATIERQLMAQRNFEEAKRQLVALMKNMKDEKPAEATKPIETAKPAEPASPTEATKPKE